MENKFEVGDCVSLPMGEVGIIMEIVSKQFDYFPYKVKIKETKFNRVGEIVDYNIKQLIRENKKETK